MKLLARPSRRFLSCLLGSILYLSMFVEISCADCQLTGLLAVPFLVEAICSCIQLDKHAKKTRRPAAARQTLRICRSGELNGIPTFLMTAAEHSRNSKPCACSPMVQGSSTQRRVAASVQSRSTRHKHDMRSNRNRNLRTLIEGTAEKWHVEPGCVRRHVKSKLESKVGKRRNSNFDAQNEQPDDMVLA